MIPNICTTGVLPLDNGNTPAKFAHLSRDSFQRKRILVMGRVFLYVKSTTGQARSYQLNEQANNGLTQEPISEIERRLSPRKLRFSAR